MRLNTNNYNSILSKSGLTDSDVCKSTGLSEKTLIWILENQCIEVSTLEHIADALGVVPAEIALPDISGSVENVIEWQRGSAQATLSISQRRTITRVKKLAEEYPEECFIIAENSDGSIYAHVPTNWVKITPPKKISEKQMEHIKNLHQK